MVARNPFGLITAGFDWYGRSGRLRFALVLLLWAIMAGAAVYGLERPQWPGWARTISLIGLAVTTVPLFGHALRRLNELGWSGWWVWLLLVPLINAGLVLFLLLRRRNGRHIVNGTPLRLLGLIGVGLLSILIVSRLFWTPYQIASGSMKPALLVGDLVMVTAAKRHPDRGDIVVFRHPVSGVNMVARVIGMPGETIALVNGVVQVNGAPAAQSDAGFFDEVMQPQGPLGLLPRCLNGAVGQGAMCQKRRWQEVLPDGAIHDVLNIGDFPLDNIGPFKVPPGRLFLLGDNRDIASDSRIAPAAGGLGFVPMSDISGQVRRIILSAAGTYLWQVWTWRANRFWVTVQ